MDRLVTSIAEAEVPASSVAPLIRQCEQEIATLEAQLRRPRPELPDVERLREALTQRAADWKRDLGAEPQVARLLLRRLIGPIVLFEMPAPAWVAQYGRDGLDADVTWEAPTKPGLLEGLALYMIWRPQRDSTKSGRYRWRR